MMQFVFEYHLHIKSGIFINHNKLTMIIQLLTFTISSVLFGCVLQRVHIVHYRWNVTYFNYAANSVTERYSQGEHYLFIVPVL